MTVSARPNVMSEDTGVKSPQRAVSFPCTATTALDIVPVMSLWAFVEASTRMKDDGNDTDPYPPNVPPECASYLLVTTIDKLNHS